MPECLQGAEIQVSRAVPKELGGGTIKSDVLTPQSQSNCGRHWVNWWLAIASQRGGVVGPELRFELFSQVVCWLLHA
jgi:hypothetical protein